MPPGPELPVGLALVRTTNVFDQHSVPAGLLRAHRTAPGVWGRLMVQAGKLGFVFEDDLGTRLDLGPGESVAIPPQRAHHVIVEGAVRFVVEFHRTPDVKSPVAGG